MFCSRVKVIDDDIDFTQLMPVDESAIDIYTTGEDAPQIAGIIDERPLNVQLAEKFNFDSSRWKVVNEDDGFNSKIIISEQHSRKKNSKKTNNDLDDEPVALENEPKILTIDSDNDDLPRQKSKNTETSPRQKTRNYRQNSSDRDEPRRKQNERRKRSSDSDNDVPRKKQDRVRKPLSSDSDNDVPRRKEHNSDSDHDVSRRNGRSSQQNEDSDNDFPRRKRQNSSDMELPRKIRQGSSDNDVPRKRQDDSDNDNLPRRTRKMESPNRVQIKQEPDSDNDNLPRRKRPQEGNVERKKSRWRNASPEPIKKEPVDQPRKSSKPSKTVVSFNIRNPDQAEKKQKEEARKEQLEKYDRWGKGLKQVSDQQQRLEDDIHEMQKPLARYADDEDLENYLKEQERDGDPMLEYIRKQKAEERGETSTEVSNPLRPRYQGAFNPNRFGIPPGHRWDGVDRSNGYENSWTEAQNARRIVETDAYKWSTEDM